MALPWFDAKSGYRLRSQVSFPFLTCGLPLVLRIGKKHERQGRTAHVERKFELGCNPGIFIRGENGGLAWLSEEHTGGSSGVYTARLRGHNSQHLKHLGGACAMPCLAHVPGDGRPPVEHRPLFPCVRPPPPMSGFRPGAAYWLALV